MTDRIPPNDPHWQGVLAAREKELQRDVRTVNAEEDMGTRDPHASVGDSGDVAQERIRGAVRYAEKERDLDELRDIEAARERLQRGEFGLCVDCGVEIARARLEANPASARCIECQERYELTHPVEVRLPPDL